MLHAYHPSNRVPLSGWVMLVIAALCGGLVLGGLAFALSQYIWLIILFPAGLGLAAGVLPSEMIQKHNVRSPFAAAVAALLMGLMIYGTIHYLGYLVFHSGTSDLLVAEHGPIDLDTQAAFVDSFLADETGSTGFLGYLKLEAQAGVSIGSIGSASALRLNESLTWLYWAIEVGITTGIATLATVASARKPFCEACQRWYSGGEHQGNVAGVNIYRFLELIDSGKMRQAGALLQAESLPSPSLEVYIHRCPKDQEHPSILAIRSTRIDAKGNVEAKDIVEGMISPYDTRALRQVQAAS